MKKSRIILILAGLALIGLACVTENRHKELVLAATLGMICLLGGFVFYLIEE